MIAYPDTSFLCALYRMQENSPAAARWFAGMREPLHVSTLLLFEFRQGVRYQTFLHARDKRKGYGKVEADAALAALQTDLGGGALVVLPVDWPEVHAKAEHLSAQHTPQRGPRGFDILHMATALHLGARDFLSFDLNQRGIAKSEGLNPVP